MKKIFFVSIAAVVLLAPGLSLEAAQPFAGRWDLTVTTPKDTYPSWMEVTESGGQPQVRTTAEWLDGQIKVTWEFHAAGGKLTGTQKRADGVEGQIAGARAPALKRKAPVAWTKPESLFDGKDTNGWEPDDPSHNHWVAQDGELVDQAAGANLRTTRKFGDFKLHIEYNCPNGGNSGVYLRGRYEVQVLYDKSDKLHDMGSIYGFLAPAVDVAPRPGEWESYDVTLVGRTVTVVRDGQIIIDGQEIPGITGGAIDSREGEPGPIYLQGDHTGGMKYRNITIAAPQR
ncbi:MAG: DUF1080 domain-containing protein [Bryobacteraceae bacterium]